jgi:methylmalonyl-CoA/ethylmalonyl-CoA epimerase
MISRIDHVSIAVQNHGKAARFFQDVTGAVAGAEGADPVSQYFWQIFSLGDLSRLEIISPTGGKSFLKGFLQSREAGVHHITLQTPDIRQAMARLRAHRVPFFGYHEYPGGDWKEVFIHPRDAFGVLIQIAEFDAQELLPDVAGLSGPARWEVENTPGGATITLAHRGGGMVSI